MATLLYLAAAFALTASAAPSPSSPVQINALAAAYNSIAADIEPATNAPFGAGNEVIDYDPSPVYSSASAEATDGAIEKRQSACEAYPPGNGPAVHNPDTPEAFAAYPPFHRNAQFAPVPVGYYPVLNFRDLNASASTNNYMGFNASFDSYDVFACASQCSAIQGCQAFNLYYERDPTVNANDVSCPNPPSLTRIKCVYWGTPLTRAVATNFGQYQSQFRVVIAGSDAYNAIPFPPVGFKSPVSFSASVVATPSGDSSFMGSVAFADSPYDPVVCAKQCASYNQDSTDGRTCSFFTAASMMKNGANPALVCSYYTKSWSASYATNSGFTDADGNRFTFANSYGFAARS